MQFLHVLRIFCGKEAVCITHIVTEPQCGACGVPTKVGWPCCHQFLLQGISCLLLRQLARHSLSYLKINIMIMIMIILTQYYDDHEQADTHTHTVHNCHLSLSPDIALLPNLFFAGSRIRHHHCHQTIIKFLFEGDTGHWILYFCI